MKHQTVVFYFHGGAYLLGDPESMIDAANVYNSQGYRFCSVGFRWVPFHRFPAQLDDAMNGIKAAVSWMDQNGIATDKIAIGGASAGGHLAMMICYGRELQRKYDFPAEKIRACISIAGISNADDMLVKPFPCYALWRRYVDLPTFGSRTRESMREAAAPYSPIKLLDELSAQSQPDEETSLPPFLAIHGYADKMSPYVHEVEFVDKLNAISRGNDGAYGTGGSNSAGYSNKSSNGSFMPPSRLATLRTIDKWTWQHMILTVTLHKHKVESFAPLRELFAWLGKIDEG